MLEVPSPPDILHVLSAFRVQGRFCDVRVEFAETGRREFLAHRLVLVAFSSFFADACEGNDDERIFRNGDSSVSWRRVIVPSSIADDALDFIISWMYDESPKIDFTLDDYERNWKWLVNLRIAAESLGIQALKRYLDDCLLTLEGVCRAKAVAKVEAGEHDGKVPGTSAHVDNSYEENEESASAELPSFSPGIHDLEEIDDCAAGGTAMSDEDDDLGNVKESADGDWNPTRSTKRRLSKTPTPSSKAKRAARSRLIVANSSQPLPANGDAMNNGELVDDFDPELFGQQMLDAFNSGTSTSQPPLAPEVFVKLERMDETPPPLHPIKKRRKRKPKEDGTEKPRLKKSERWPEPRLPCEKCAKLVGKYHMKDHMQRYHGDITKATTRLKTFERCDPILYPCIVNDQFQCTQCSFVASRYEDAKPKDDDDHDGDDDGNKPGPSAGKKHYKKHRFYVRCAKHLYMEHGITCPNLCFPCPKEGCLTVSWGKFASKKHLETHDENISFASPCSVCGKSFKNLENHVLTMHGGDAKLPCSTCGKTFRNENYLKAHVKHRHGKPKFHCDKCDSFSTHFELHYKHHRYTKHGILTPPDAPVYSCEGCNYKSPSKSILDRHVRVTQHSADPNAEPVTMAVCPEPNCGKTYRTERLAQQHYRGVHRAGYVSNCSQCDQVFYSKSGLHYHLWRVHQVGKNGDVPNSVACRIAKPFRCGYCDHVTGLDGNMRKHVANRHRSLPMYYVDLRKHLADAEPAQNNELET